MKGRQLRLLFVLNLITLSVALGLMPLLPLYARQLGATPTITGLYMASIYVTLALGTALTGWLVRKAGSRKRLFVLAGAVGAPMLVLMGWAGNVWALAAATGVLWACGGIQLALISILTGLYAGREKRGKIFGLMYLAYPLGALVGGALAAWLVAQVGYRLLFPLLGLLWIVMPALAQVRLADPQRAGVQAAGTGLAEGPARLGSLFPFLMFAAFLAAVTLFVGRLGTSLSMEAAGFAPGAVSGASAVGGLAALPLVPLSGWVSDRLGRKRFLAFAYLLSAAGVLLLSPATETWHFWIAVACLSTSAWASGPLASALAVDLLPAEAIGRGLPLLSAMTWTGGIAGFAAAGVLTELLGAASLYAMAAGLAGLAALSLVFIQPEPAVQPAVPPAERPAAVVANPCP